MLQLATLFYQGRYQDILAATIEAPTADWPRPMAAYVIGALSFVGRIDDALVLMRKHASDLDARGTCATRFFVGIGLVRVSRYDEGRALLAQNLAAVRDAARAAKTRGLAPDAIARFYAYQGLAFFRYFQCRYPQALSAAKAAWAAALEGEYPYGQSLAADLRGHAMVRTGQIAAGLTALDEAARLNVRFGLGGVAHAVTTAQFYYRAAHGLFGARTLEELTAFARTFAPEDNFTLAVAQCELARQLAVRGRVREAEGYLESAARVILKAGHQRHKAMVLHRFAHNRYYQGRFPEALAYLDEAEAGIGGAYAHDYLLQIAGLRLKIGRRQGKATAGDAAAVLRLTALVGSGIGRNIAWRDLGAFAPTLTGDDLLGDLRHRCRLGAQTPYADVWALLKAGMLGFLHEIVPRGAETRLVCFDLVPKRLAVFDDGDVVVSERPISRTLKAVALQLARAPSTKKELVETHWGYEYHSLRHDPFIYAMINRLRRALGAAGAWLLHDGDRYLWAPNVRVFTYEPIGADALDLDLDGGDDEDDDPLGERTATATAAPTAAGGAPVAGRPSRRADGTRPLAPSREAGALAALNHRQIATLSELERRPFMSAQDCVALFDVSRITAFRDLGELTRLGLTRRRGKGRATHYELARRES
jgi:hypothetical protein